MRVNCLNIFTVSTLFLLSKCTTEFQTWDIYAYCRWVKSTTNGKVHVCEPCETSPTSGMILRVNVWPVSRRIYT